MQARVLLLTIVLLALMTIPGVATIPVTTAQDSDESLTLPPWDGQRRFTILVMGMDRRPGARDTLNVRVDALLLISVNPGESSIGMLHIPRDLHMPTPYSDKYIRVNTLMVEGERLQEGYGPYYAMDTFQYNLGMYIDRYIAFDFEAFVAVVDALGGIDIYTPYTIIDGNFPDMNYGYDPFYLSVGWHHLNGYNALRYARTRHMDSDVMRGNRQMQVVTAIHQRITDGNMLPDLIKQAPSLFETISRNIYTDLSLPEIIQLGSYAVSLPSESLQTGSIDEDYRLYYAIPSGGTQYIPNRELLPELLSTVFGEHYSE